MSIYKKHGVTGRIVANLPTDAQRTIYLRTAIKFLLREETTRVFSFLDLHTELGIAPEHRGALMQAMKTLVDRNEVLHNRHDNLISYKE